MPSSQLRRPPLDNCKEIFDRVKFRTKFEVSLAVWNPKIDLLALGSKEGDLVVKRYLWKTGWKRNFSRASPLKPFEALIDGSNLTDPTTSKPKKDELISLSWSPDGQILLVVFASGRCFYLDTQTGNTLFIRKLGFLPINISWEKYKVADKLVKNNFPLQGDDFFPISAVDFNFREDASKEHAAVSTDIELFYRKALHQSMAGTFLCVLHLNESNQQIQLDIIADGILLVQRINIQEALTVCLKSPINSKQISTKQCTIKNGQFRVPFSIENGLHYSFLQLPEQITPNRQRIYSQISDCFCWISFCCLYLQEMFNYCTNNWQQASEAFHQRVFAIVNSHRSPRTIAADQPNNSATPSNFQRQHSAKEGALEMCRDLLVILEEGEASDLLDKFFSHPTTEKELKQAASFIHDFSSLIKGISSGLLPASLSLRHAIRTLRAHLTNLAMNLEEENPGLDPAQILLDLLLKIANGNSSPALFNPIQNLGEECEQFLTEFEQSTHLLEQKFQTILELAKKNQKELEMLLHWLMALIFESGNHCESTIDVSQFDVNKLTQFIAELVNRSSLNDSLEGKCILDRLYSHLVAENDENEEGRPKYKSDEQQPMEMDLDEEAEENSPNSSFVPIQQNNHFVIKKRRGVLASLTGKQLQSEAASNMVTVGQHLQKCFQHFRAFFNDGITKIVHSPPLPLEKCSIILPAEGELEEESGFEEEEEEGMMISGGNDELGEMEERGRRREGRKQPTLHAFIFGYDQHREGGGGMRKMMSVERK